MIRPARAGDAPEIGRLWEALVAYHHEIDPDLPLASPGGAAHYTARVLGRLDDPNTRVFVAESPDGDGRLIGYVLAVIVDMAPEMFQQTTGGFLADIFVEADARRSGVGRALVAAVTDWLSGCGVGYFEWYVAANNAAGQAFWRAVGGRGVMLRMRATLGSQDAGV